MHNNIPNHETKTLLIVYFPNFLDSGSVSGWVGFFYIQVCTCSSLVPIIYQYSSNVFVESQICTITTALGGIAADGNANLLIKFVRIHLSYVHFVCKIS